MRRSSCVLFAGLLSLAALACSSDDADDGDSVGTYGTCDRSASAFRCIESTGEPINIRNQRDGCLDQGGEWSTDPCPSENLVACCDYEFGLEFRECTYEGATIDLEEACMMVAPESCACEQF